MTELISEPIHPVAGTFDAAQMASGVPSLPTGFSWRGCSLSVLGVLAAWKHSSREGGRAAGELYLRRHYYRLAMTDRAVWTVYFLRQRPASGSAKTRWFLYTVDHPAPRCAAAAEASAYPM